MRSLRWSTLAVLILASLLQFTPRQANSGGGTLEPISQSTLFGAKSVALVVANRVYGSKSFVTPANDAYAIALRLTQLGISVTAKANVTLVEFQRALEDFARDCKTANSAIFYYTGSGSMEDGISYLMPIDAEPAKNEEDLKKSNISITDVFKACADAPFKLIVVDASQTSRLRTSGDRTKLSLVKLPSEVPPDSLVVYSTGPGHEAIDSLSRFSDDGTSPFATELLARMDKGLELRALFDQVRDGVRIQTRGKQQPFVNSTLDGGTDFYLSLPAR